MPGAGRPYFLSPDGAFFGAMGPDRKVWVWESKGGDEFAKIPVQGFSPDFAFSRDGKTLAVVNMGQVDLLGFPSMERTAGVVPPPTQFRMEFGHVAAEAEMFRDALLIGAPEVSSAHSLYYPRSWRR